MFRQTMGDAARRTIDGNSKVCAGVDRLHLLRPSAGCTSSGWHLLFPKRCLASLWLLAGLLELEPWIRQWYDAVDLASAGEGEGTVISPLTSVTSDVPR